MRHSVTTSLVLAFLCCGRVEAQGIYTAEELRDLARPVTPGASTLALGGTRGSGLGDATDGAFNPAALVIGPRADAVFSIGGFRYARDELQRTPVGQTFEDSLVTVTGRPRVIGSGAVAMRWRRVALGASYDAVERLDYGRDIERVRWLSWVQLLQDSRRWSLSVRHQRIGGAFGAVMPGDLAALGVSIQAVRTRIGYTGDGRNSESGYNDRLARYVANGVTENRARLDADRWNLGVTLGALMRPHPRVDVSVRYVRQPAAHVVLEGAQRSTVAGFESFSNTVIHETHALVDAPDIVSGAATLRVGAFRIVGEAGAVLAAGTFRDERPRTSDYCSSTGSIAEAGPPNWATRYVYPCWELRTAPQSRPLATHSGADVRAGVERGWERGRVSWWLRGGISREASAMLQVPEDIDDSFLPPQPSRTWGHVGGGLRIGRLVTDLGVARWQRQYRLLVDVKVATSGTSRTAYGSRR
jgi:hypothetical protein